MSGFYDFFDSMMLMMEAPNRIPGDLPPINHGDAKMSNPVSKKNLSENYTLISNINPATAGGITIGIYTKPVNSSKMLVLGMTDIGDDAYLKCIFSMMLVKNTSKFLPENTWSVESVFTDDGHKNQGIGSSVYSELVHHNHIILSDDSQYDGAFGLWKRLAAQSNALGVNVKIFDYRQLNFLTDSTGSDIYDGSNIPEDKIWGTTNRGHVRLLLIPR